MKNKQPVLYLLGIFMLIIWGCKKEDNSKIRNGERYYYYGFEEKIYINKLNNKLAVKYNDNEAAKKSTSDIASFAKGAEFLWHNERTVVITLNPNVVNNVMTLLTKDNNVISANPVYILASGSDSEMFFTDEFAVKFKPTTSPAEIKKINDRYGVRIIEETDIYTLLTVPRLADALEIANKYQESGLVVYSEPNFYMKIEFGSTAEYLPKETFKDL
ncbi:S8 family serine peptidase [Albibacterium bauzanense]|uniref:Fervidolysin-like N-terminal prodomain domain-containing protein n=1 Tax=Albibacterium bauzanense TaxID=653929 RepID=A0A4R1M2W8_9SPHI|nr:hypothetical protein [Albibacterium bauzanense]TCK85390.1 hypothetical protein C8N28_0696 [Albibacterium bauzanense]